MTSSTPRSVPWRGSLLAAASAALAMQANAATFELSGNFGHDDDIQFISLDVSDPGTVAVTSFGYAGGTDALGQVIASGGFDSMLFLYDSAGTLVAQSDDGIAAPTDPSTGLAADAAFSLSLAPGHYTLALTQYDNFPLGNLADGFSRAGTGNFTGALFQCSAGAFCDWSGASRTSHWALEISGVSAVPEPGALALWLGGLGLVLARRRCSAARG